MYFWGHTRSEEEEEFSHSKRNYHEAKKITEVAKTFCLEGGVSPSKITVLCSYRGQASFYCFFLGGVENSYHFSTVLFGKLKIVSEQ